MRKVFNILFIVVCGILLLTIVVPFVIVAGGSYNLCQLIKLVVGMSKEAKRHGKERDIYVDE